MSLIFKLNMAMEDIYLEEKTGGEKKKNRENQGALKIVFKLYDYIRYFVLFL